MFQIFNTYEGTSPPFLWSRQFVSFQQYLQCISGYYEVEEAILYNAASVQLTGQPVVNDYTFGPVRTTKIVKNERINVLQH